MAKPGSLAHKAFVGVKLTPEEDQQLDQLAQETCRTRADVVRWLLRQALRTHQPDVALVGSTHEP